MLKRKLSRPASLLLLLLAACSDPTGSSRVVSSISISENAVTVDERTIGVGEAIQLAASPRNSAGNPLSGFTVEWSSSAPGIVSVDGGGVARGVAVGTAWIRARAGGVMDSVRVNVSEPLTGEVACDPSTPALSLAVGEAHLTSGYAEPTLCVPGGVTGAEYLLIPFHASRIDGGATGSRLSMELAAAGTVASLTSMALEEQRPARGLEPVAASGTRDDDFHLRLRERTLVELEPRRREMRSGGGMEPVLSTGSRTPTVGEILNLNVRTDSACAAPRHRPGRVVAVTNHAIVVADTTNPQGGFSEQEYATFGARFDDLVFPLATQTFGEPGDIDGNRRVVVFFTRGVNELTQAGSGFYVSGFFFDRDLFPRTGRGACEGSNGGELLYLMVPDPERARRGERAFEKANVERRTVAILGHELQHLVNASRRLHVNGAEVWEEVWLNEGLSHVMEELLFFAVSGLSPGGNHDARLLSDPQQRSAFESFQLDNFERLIQYMSNPQSNSIIAGNTLAVRGAAWSLLRYLADRRGGSQRELWYRLANSTTAGMDNLSSALGTDPLAWSHDWAVSLATDDFVHTSARFQQPSWNYRSIVPASRTLLGHMNPGYPLAMPFLRSGGDPTTVSLHSGGASFHRFSVEPGQQAAIRTTSGGLRAPEKLKLALVRVR